MEATWALKEPEHIRLALSPLGHREPRRWPLQCYMSSWHLQAAEPQTLQCLLPFWLTNASPKYVLTKHIPSPLLHYPTILLGGGGSKRGRTREENSKCRPTCKCCHGDYSRKGTTLLSGFCGSDGSFYVSV